jgi:hypothetical protein
MSVGGVVTNLPLKSRRRWLRFSLRFLLLLVAVISIPLAWKFNQVRNQRIAVAEINELNGYVRYGHENRGLIKSPGPKWWTNYLGDDFFANIASVHFVDPQVTNETLARLPTSTHIRVLYLVSKNVTDDGLKHLARLPSLNLLYLEGVQFTDAGLEQLSEMKNLRHLALEGTAITDAGLRTISGLSKLESLGIKDNLQITDTGLAELTGMPNLISLQLSNTSLDAAGVKQLRKALPQCQVVAQP